MSKKEWIQYPYSIKIDQQGRLVIPHVLRNSMGLTGGSKIYIAIIGEEDYDPKKSASMFNPKSSRGFFRRSD